MKAGKSATYFQSSPSCVVTAFVSLAAAVLRGVCTMFQHLSLVLLLASLWTTRHPVHGTVQVQGRWVTGFPNRLHEVLRSVRGYPCSFPWTVGNRGDSRGQQVERGLLLSQTGLTASPDSPNDSFSPLHRLEFYLGLRKVFNDNSLKKIFKNEKSFVFKGFHSRSKPRL